MTTPPIAADRRNRRWWVPGGHYPLAGSRRPRPADVLRTAGTRLFVRSCSGCATGWLRRESATPRSVLGAYPGRRRATAEMASRLAVFVFIPYLPTFIGGPAHFLKRLLKGVDAAIVRRLLAYADGAFPITGAHRSGLARGGQEYWTMEGVSDAAAAALASARSDSSYVYRGTHGRRCLTRAG